MRHLLVVCAVALGSAVASSAAVAGTECDGQLVCIPVAGPWVLVPAQTGSHRVPTYYRLTCPEGAVVGGLDADLTHRTIDVTFIGSLGGPVSPGVTTSRAAVFVATETGAFALPTAFRPLLGCIPATGGGGRARTGYTPVRTLYAARPVPARPTVRRVKTARLRAGSATSIFHACGRGERLVSFSAAIAFHTKRAPSAQLLSLVEVRSAVRGGRVVANARAGDLPGGLRVEVQVHAVCAEPLQ